MISINKLRLVNRFGLQCFRPLVVVSDEAAFVPRTLYCSSNREFV